MGVTESINPAHGVTPEGAGDRPGKSGTESEPSRTARTPWLSATCTAARLGVESSISGCFPDGMSEPSDPGMFDEDTIPAKPPQFIGKYRVVGRLGAG